MKQFTKKEKARNFSKIARTIERLRILFLESHKYISDPSNTRLWWNFYPEAPPWSSTAGPQAVVLTSWDSREINEYRFRL